MPHRIHKCTNTLYDYAIINFNTYVSLMYELKKNGRVFTSKYVGTGPSSYEIRICRAAVSQKLRNTSLEYHWYALDWRMDSVITWTSRKDTLHNGITFRPATSKQSQSSDQSSV